MADNTQTIGSAGADPSGRTRPADSGYRDANRDNAGGLSNRPSDEERNIQPAVPESGQAETSGGDAPEEDWPTERSDR